MSHILGMTGSGLINLNHPAHYFSVGPFSVSMGNAIIIGIMFALFALALLLPFPGHKKGEK
jgi:hypothetical protein